MIKIYVPAVDVLAERIVKDPVETRRWLSKAEFWLGPSESIDLAKKFMDDAHPKVRSVGK